AAPWKPRNSVYRISGIARPRNLAGYTATCLQFAHRAFPALTVRPSTTSSITFVSEVRQSGKVISNVWRSAALESREFLGRRAGVGYSEVVIGTILASCLLLSRRRRISSTIAVAKPYHETHPCEVML